MANQHAISTDQYISIKSHNFHDYEDICVILAEPGLSFPAKEHENGDYGKIIIGEIYILVGVPYRVLNAFFV